MRFVAPGTAEHLISRRIEIDAAHRVMRHRGKCRNLHGHRYVVEAWCAGPLAAREQEGMVLDFAFLKEEMVALVDEHCDHGAIFFVDDPLLHALLGPDAGLKSAVDREGFACKESPFGKFYVLPYSPTAENLARHWFGRLQPRIGARSDGRARLVMVKVWETPNCWAAYGPLVAADGSGGVAVAPSLAVE